LWDVLENIILSQDPDMHVWRLDASGSFSSKSCYKAFFLGAITFEPWKRLWKSWAPPKCKVFLWLALRNKCWTTDCLAMRGLPHPSQCVLCDQEEETVQHILTSCVFARQFWHHLLAALGMSSFAPSNWKSGETKKKGFNSLLILGAWTLWNHRNKCVFEGRSPSIPAALKFFREESKIWCLAGASKLQALIGLDVGLGSGGGLR
ncbi:hypothetical protein U9M48_030445, partial [Paspalum notatum var. saurae]